MKHAWAFILLLTPSLSAQEMTLEARWRKAAMFYNTGFYEEAAQEFDQILRQVPKDALTEKFFREAKRAALYDVKPEGEAPPTRDFSRASHATEDGEPVEDLPGVGISKKPKPAVPAKAAPTTENSQAVAPVPVSPKTPAASAASKTPPVAVSTVTLLKPTDPQKREFEALYSRAVALFNENRHAEALAEFEKILKTHPDHTPSLLRAQKCREALEKKQDLPEASPAFETN